MILQAFNRCLILAPEIYGNPWLLRDDEFPRLARIYNLHRRYRDILVHGMTLPEEGYGPYAVSRGDGQTRFLALAQPDLAAGEVQGKTRFNHRLDRRRERLTCGSSIPRKSTWAGSTLAPSPRFEVLPFRACLIMATTKPKDDLGVIGCDYAIVRDVPGKPVVLKLMAMPGHTVTVQLEGAGQTFTGATLDGQKADELLTSGSMSISFPGRLPKDPWHRKLGDLKPVDVPVDAEGLYQATCFAADNNALEARSLERSGPTRVPAVQKARDAFFASALFVDKGIWDKNLFDGRMETRFTQAPAWGGKPAHGGALRVDFGGPIHVDRLVLRGEATRLPEGIDGIAEVSEDLKTWRPARLSFEKDAITAAVPGGGPVRFFRMNAVPAPLAEIEGYRAAKALDRTKWRASNLFSPYSKTPAVAAWSLSCKLNDTLPGSYLAIPLPGRHKAEGAFAAVRVGGRLLGAPCRAVSYNANVWEAPVQVVDGNYTYFVPLTSDVRGRQIDIVVLVMKDGANEIQPEAWVTGYPAPFAAKQLVLERKE